MSTTKEFKGFVLGQLGLFGEILCRPMMGEYLLYNDGQLFGGIYDDRLLIKITQENKKFKLKEEIPYKGAKPMYMIENLDDTELIREIVLCTCEGLSKVKSKTKK